MTPATLGIIGYGSMGAAISGGLIDSQRYMPSDIHVCDTRTGALETARQQGHFTHDTIAGLCEKTSTVIIAVKPKDVSGVLENLADSTTPKLVISVAAGITTAVMEEVLGKVAVIRAMPNTPCMVGSGATVIARGTAATDEDADTALTLLRATGYVTELPESLMDAVTGLSGSGPAYAALMIDALADGGVQMGLPRNEAVMLAAETMRGAADLILKKGLHPSELRDMVTSPGGTTIAGLSVLELNAFRGTVIAAVEAAANRSRALGQN